MIFWNSHCFFNDPVDVGNLIPGFSAFSKSSLNIWKFTVHVLLMNGLENFEHYFDSVWDECNCAVVWRRQWHPTPVLLPGKSHGQRSLVGCSLGSQRIGHDWATSLSLFTFMHWRRKWQPTPGFMPGEAQGRGSLVGCCLWGRTESDRTEVT